MEEHAPPPPYSETDIYSHSSNNGSANNRNIVSPANSADNASAASRGRSDPALSSTGGSIVYTPPHTPDGSIYQENPSADNLSYASSSAAAYFESRPATKALSGKIIIHTVILMPDTKFEDVPYPEPKDTWLSRDVTEQDWATFVNFLLPRHTDVSNAEIAERKLKAEVIDERMHRLTLDSQHTSRTDLRQVDAQLDPLRKSHGQELDASALESIALQWNDGFFAPRGIQIQISIPQFSEQRTDAIPGAWPSQKDTRAIPDDPSENSRRSSRRAYNYGVGPIRAGTDGFHIGGLMSADKEGFRLLGRRGIVADRAGFRIGSLLSAGEEGLKIGPILFGSEGSIRRTPPAASYVPAPPQMPQTQARGMTRGIVTPPVPAPPPAPPAPYGTTVPPVPPVPAGPSASRGRSLNDYDQYREKPRARSASTSSESSESSASSESSIGSLPDYDHLRSSQLPVVKQSLTDWLNHPDHPVTKGDVKQLKQEIKNAKGSGSSLSDADMKVLRQEVRDLLRSFRDMKRGQRSQRRALKRERRTLRRQRKHERKALRREAKRERKMQKGKGRALGGYVHPATMPLPPPSTGSLSPPGMISGVTTFQPPPVNPRSRDLSSEQGTRIQAEAQRLLQEAEKKIADASRLREQARMMPADDKGRLQLLDVVEGLEEEAGQLQREAERLLAEAFEEERGVGERGVGRKEEEQGQESGVIRG